MILEREFYKSISTTRAISKSLRAYLFTSMRFIFKGRNRRASSNVERGLPELQSTVSCSGCSDCETICPTNSLALLKSGDKLKSLNLDVKKCIFCGLCEEVCSPKVLTLTDYRTLSSHGESSWVIDLAEESGVH